MVEKKECPVSVGDELELKCLSLGAKGDGIFKVNSFVIIAKGARMNESYNLRINKVLPTIAFADIVGE